MNKNHYNLRNKKRKRRYLTKHGYLKEDYVEDDSFDYRDAEYVGLINTFSKGEIWKKEYENGKEEEEEDEYNIENMWKIGLSSKEISKIEPELKQIRTSIIEETPTIPKIISSNVTKEDKKRCIKLFDRLQYLEPYAPQYDKTIETINNIIRKSKNYKKREIQKLEQIETRLKNLSTPSDDLKTQILNLDASEKVKTILYNQYLEMLEHEQGSQAYNNIREEIEWSVRLPHNTAKDFINLSSMNNKQLNIFYSDFLNKMDKELYGMKNIKMKMLRILNDRRKGSSGSNIAIVGPPGCGKTSIGKAFAKVLNLPFEKISVGGLEDASVLKGDKKVWSGAAPSIILQILARMKSSNGVVMFDEVDKLGETKNGVMVQYALLHISDYVHNKDFSDNYLNKYTHDFSKIFFIYNMNRTDTLDPALLSRMDIINVDLYTEEEKINIITEYTLPRALEDINLKRSDITITKKATEILVKICESDDGLRGVEKIIKDLVGKINLYNSILLDDGTTGNIALPYKISKFPLIINEKLLKNLMN